MSNELSSASARGLSNSEPDRVFGVKLLYRKISLKICASVFIIRIYKNNNYAYYMYVYGCINFICDFLDKFFVVGLRFTSGAQHATSSVLGEGNAGKA